MTNIVLLTRDRPRLLRQCLDSLFGSVMAGGHKLPRHQPHQFTLTVVDDGTTDNVAQRLLSDLPRNYCHLELHRRSDHNIGALRSGGVLSSALRFGRGEWLYLSDNDVYFTVAWLERLTDLAESTESLGFRLWGGQVHPFHQPVASESRFTEHATLDGPSMLMRWNTWDNCGPMSGNGPGVYQGEDVFFCKAVTNKGGRIAVASPHVVYHTGLTNSEGKPATGYPERAAQRKADIYYE